MPLWRIFYHPSAFTSDQKAALAKAITNIYASPPARLPEFYVNVLFIPVQEDEYYIGGEARTNFVRIVIEQIARAMPDPSTEEGKGHRKAWMDRITEVSLLRSLHVVSCSVQR